MIVTYRGDMRHDEVNVSVIGEESNPVSVSSHEVFCLAVDSEELPIGFSIACDG